MQILQLVLHATEEQKKKDERISSYDRIRTASPSTASIVVSCITKYMSAKGANNASSRFN